MNAFVSQTADWSFAKKIKFAGFAIAFICLLVLTTAEVGGRIFLHYKYGVPGKSYGLWQSDSELGAIHRTNGYNSNGETNSYGFRNHENPLEPKPENALRIIAYGGSTTFCYNLETAETWPSQLQLALRRDRHDSDQVLNGGAILWSLGHLYVRAKRDLPILKPDYVVIYAGINEETNNAYLAREGVSLDRELAQGNHGKFSTSLDQTRWLKRNLVSIRIYDYLIAPQIRKLQRKVFSRRKGSPSVSPGDSTAELSSEITLDKLVLKNYLLVLQDMFDLVRQFGGEPVFVIQATGDGSARNKRLVAYSRTGASLAQDQGVAIIDAQTIVDRYVGDPMDLFYRTGVHYSAAGASIIAQAIGKEIIGLSVGTN